MENAHHYFHGDACRWTGKTQELHGATFYVYVLLEGHRKGEECVSPEKPNLKEAA